MLKFLWLLILVYLSIVFFFYTFFMYLDSLKSITEPKQLPAKVIKLKKKGRKK